MSNHMTPEFIRDALDIVAERDDDLGDALGQFGYPAPRNREPGFPTLINIIIGQQVSTHAAAAIRNRLEAAVNPLTPETFLATNNEALRGVGGILLDKRTVGRTHSPWVY